MSGTEFTQGPWKVEKELFAKSYQWLISYDAKDKGRGIAIAETIGATGKELANARLIAAAPNLYAELEKLIDEIETLMSDSDAMPYSSLHIICEEGLMPNTKTARAVLAKARGGV